MFQEEKKISSRTKTEAIDSCHGIVIWDGKSIRKENTVAVYEDLNYSAPRSTEVCSYITYGIRKLFSLK